MPLVKETLKAALVQAFSDQMNKKENPEQAIDDLVSKLATAIDNYIKSATVTIAPGILVATVGTAASQTGTTTGSGTGTLS
jgi:hypothetical protein